MAICVLHTMILQADSLNQAKIKWTQIQIMTVKYSKITENLAR